MASMPTTISTVATWTRPSFGPAFGSLNWSSHFSLLLEYLSERTSTLLGDEEVDLARPWVLGAPRCFRGGLPFGIDGCKTGMG